MFPLPFTSLLDLSGLRVHEYEITADKQEQRQAGRDKSVGDNTKLGDKQALSQ